MKAIEGLTDTQKLQREFWQAFIEYAYNKPDFALSFGRRKAYHQSWYDLTIGSSEYHVLLTANTQKKRLGVGIYIRDNKELYAKIAGKKDAIEEFLGVQLEWKEADKACNIMTLCDGDIKKGPSAWESIFDWFIETALKFKEMTKKFDV